MLLEHRTSNHGYPHYAYLCPVKPCCTAQPGSGRRPPASQLRASATIVIDDAAGHWQDHILRHETLLSTSLPKKWK